MQNIGFDKNKYLEEQSKYILERIVPDCRLYLEFGGKLMYDMHAKRVLPGFDENAKIKLLEKIKEQSEIIIVVYAGDIARNKTRHDFSITYDLEVFRTIDDFRAFDLQVNSVVITRYEDQPSVNAFINKLERRGITTYKHYHTKGYPTDVETIVSDEGYGMNPFVKVSKPLVVVTGPGPGSGKLATCLSQMYHENIAGNNVNYAKFETFPIWDLPLKHPVNVAYEAATLDLKDVNMIDPFHLEAYGVKAVNYNRDIEIFPVIKRIIEKITGRESVYQSPTDMGVNRIGTSIISDDILREAGCQEILRRYLISRCEYKKGALDEAALSKSKLLIDELEISEEDRKVVAPAREYAEYKRNLEPKYENVIVMAIELPDGQIVTGRSSRRMVAAAAAVLNAAKVLAGMPDEVLLISPDVLKTMQLLRMNVLRQKRSTLDCEEILGALAVSAMSNPLAQTTLEKIPMLRGCKAHCTAILSITDAQTMTGLALDVTTDPEYSSNNLYDI